MVNGICSDIRDLDYARRNLQTTIDTIKKLQMAMRELDQLRVMVNKYQYNEVANLLEVVKEILKKFSGWSNIDRVKELQKSFESVQRIIKRQVFDEFEHVDTKTLNQSKITNLLDAGFVIDAMGIETRKEFIDHFCTRQLSLYELMFKDGGENSKLECTDQRYQWLLKWLKNYEENYKLVFPAHWHVNVAVAEEFCVRTHQKILKILESTKSHLNVAALKSSLKKTIKFENFLGDQLSSEYESSQYVSDDENTETEIDERNLIIQKFKGIISSCFEQYMYLYVEHQDMYIKARFEEIMKGESWSVNTDSPNKVLTSATDLISVFAKVRKRITSLNQSQAFYDVFTIFQKYLGLYAEKLKEKLSAPDPLNNEGTYELVYCFILNTGDYCSKRAKEMEKIIKTEISEALREKVNLEEEEMSFQESIALSVEKLKNALSLKLEPCFLEMSRVNWEKFSAESSVGDASRYVTDMSAILKEHMPLYRKSIYSQQYFQFVCESISGWFIKRYEESILKCKQISESGAQQLLIDIAQIKKMLEEIPLVGHDDKVEVGKDTPQSSASVDRYIKKVKREMEVVEKMLKVIWSPSDILLDTYRALIPDHTDKGLVIIMKLKGISTPEQLKMLDAYGTPKDSPVRSEVTDNKPMRSGISFFS